MPDPEDRSPRPDEVDLWGLTHRGKVREENQDHFLVGTLTAGALELTGTSLADPPTVEGITGFGAGEATKRGGSTEPPVVLAMVADGVGGGPRGEEASRLTVAGVTRYLSESLRAVQHREDEGADHGFAEGLADVALRCARDLRERGEVDRAARGMATTLSLWLGIWPQGYLLQVGDSRYYLLRDGKLEQVSRDQTVAQDLLDRGAIPPERASHPRLANTLSSAIGGVETRPVVTEVEDGWGVVHLLCSDGLTKHVSDERIQQLLSEMTSARQVVEQLVAEALEDGGSDNITVVVARTGARRSPEDAAPPAR